jgi:hypothetical protein
MPRRLHYGYGPPRADDGIRTRDPHLGKVMLYQLSHVRSTRQASKADHSAARGLPGLDQLLKAHDPGLDANRGCACGTAVAPPSQLGNDFGNCLGRRARDRRRVVDRKTASESSLR